MAAKTEFDGLPMYRVIDAIIKLRAGKHLATSPRIAPLTNRTTNNISHILTYMWDWGYVRRETIRRRKTRADPGIKREPSGCVYHYRLTKKGQTRYAKLQARFGRLDKQDIEPQSCVTLPSDSLPNQTHPGDPEQPSTMTPGAGEKP